MPPVLLPQKSPGIRPTAPYICRPTVFAVSIAHMIAQLLPTAIAHKWANTVQNPAIPCVSMGVKVTIGHSKTP